MYLTKEDFDPKWNFYFVFEAVFVVGCICGDMSITCDTQIQLMHFYKIK